MCTYVSVYENAHDLLWVSTDRSIMESCSPTLSDNWSGVIYTREEVKNQLVVPCGGFCTHKKNDGNNGRGFSGCVAPCVLMRLHTHHHVCI